jgi:twitching motility protein PilU
LSNVPFIFNYLQAMQTHNASDLYLTCGYKPAVRTSKELIPLSDSPMTSESVREVLGSILTTRQRRDFETHNELNTSLDMGKNGRFRINVMQQRQEPALVIRRIVSDIPSFEDLRLPKVIEKLSMERRGLILVTGMTGSGKSTTLAAMVDYRNMNEAGHIITIEDPIEYFHEHKQSIITQREVGVDTESFYTAMKNSLRQRPDVILVGEIRDREVMEQALTISETGHLCLATIHTNNSYQAIERIVNLFPEEFHNQIRLNLSMNLRAIVSQRLVPSTQGGLVPALEILLNQGLIKELIESGQVTKIREVMEQNVSQGMCTFDQSLLALFAEGLVTEDLVMSQADQPSDMSIKIKQLKLKAAGEGGGDGFSTMDTSILSFSD